MLRYRLFTPKLFLKEVKEGSRKPKEMAERNDWEELMFFPTLEAGESLNTAPSPRTPWILADGVEGG